MVKIRTKWVSRHLLGGEARRTRRVHGGEGDI